MSTLRSFVSIFAAGFPVLLACTTTTTPSSSAHGTADDSLSAEVAALVRAEHVAGLIVSVTDAQSSAEAATSATETPLTPKSRVRFASMTKTFTATAVLRFVDSGAVKLTDAIGAHLDNLPIAWRDATLEQLLRHTSGIVDFTDRAGFDALESRDLAPHELIDLVRDEPLAFPHGEGFRYSNTGYVLLGLLLEHLGEGPYDSVVAHEVFVPAKMTSAGACSMFPDVVQGYAQDDAGSFIVAKPISIRLPYSAGGLCGTAADIVKYWQAFEGGLLSVVSRRAMTTETMLLDGTQVGYGMGVSFLDVDGTMLVGHAGDIAGFSDIMLHVLGSPITIVALSNTQDGPHQRIGIQLARRRVPARVPAEAQKRPLSSFVGAWRIAGDMDVEISIEGDKLMFGKKGGKKRLALRRDSDATFCVPTDCDTQSLTFDGKNLPTTARLQTSGLWLGARRMASTN